ncbi:MAG: ribonuclease H-like domain-containing protein [Dehalococcoidales bacterium]|nr:ribonuclease H-like domain-containing protein [Dehalococcoidales bacterium]
MPEHENLIFIRSVVYNVKEQFRENRYLETNVEAYIDIETTGLSPWDSDITVIGFYLCDGMESRSVQLVGSDITRIDVLNTLEGVDTIYTYNGARFDLPFIHHHLGVNLAEIYDHCDLMFLCWRNNLKGGLKGVEKQLGIERELPDVNGRMAIALWNRYLYTADFEALEILLKYNLEDVVNLKTLKEMLATM